MADYTLTADVGALTLTGQDAGLAAAYGAPYRDRLPKIVFTATSYVFTVIYNTASIGLDDPFNNGWLLDGDIDLSYATATPTPAIYFNPTPYTRSAFGGWWSFPSSAFIYFSGFVLFWWVDAEPTQQIGPSVRASWFYKTLTGLVPGRRYGVRIRTVWSLDTGPGNIFLEVGGNRVSLPDGAFDLWTIDPALLPGAVVNNYLAGTADGSGNLLVKFGGENYAPSSNVACEFGETEVADLSCDPTTSVHRLDFPYPIENVRSYRAPKVATQRKVFQSGHNSTWTRKGHWGVLKGEARWLPSVSALTLPLNDGWEDRDDSGTTRAGWNSFLRHARRGGAFTFYPNKDDDGSSHECAWLDPGIGRPILEDDQVRTVEIGIRTLLDELIEGYSQ